MNICPMVAPVASSIRLIECNSNSKLNGNEKTMRSPGMIENKSREILQEQKVYNSLQFSDR